MTAEFLGGAWAAVGIFLVSVGAMKLTLWYESWRVRRNLEEESDAMEGQLSMIEAMERKDAILAEVTENNSAWIEKAVAAFKALPLGELIEMTGEDIRFALVGEDGKGLLVESPPRGNSAWGPLTARLIREGYLKWSGAVRPMRAKKANGRRTFVYEIFANGDAPVRVSEQMADA